MKVATISNTIQRWENCALLSANIHPQGQRDGIETTMVDSII